MYRTLGGASLGLFLLGAVAAGQDASTWDVIQHGILGDNCAGCHQAGTSHARQSDLLLTADAAYDQLVGARPHNDAARNDGLLRVSPLGGQPGLFQSFLWEKINAPNQEHFYEDHPEYGAIMPLGDEPLTNGQLNFIKEWIFNGAPQTGSVADLALLDDTSRHEPGVFKPLPAPDNGFQLHVGPFDVWPAEKHDREFYYFLPSVTEESTYVQAYEIKYREGSHHFILYHYDEGSDAPEPSVYRDIRHADGTPIPGQFSGFHADWVVASQVPHLEYEFPQGVALRLPPGSGFDFNVHSVNRTDAPRPGEVYVNFETLEVEEVLHVAEQRFFSEYDIVLPPRLTTTLSKTFSFSETRHVVQMWTHAHEHMVEFRVEHAGGERDGELIYWTNDWEHPPLLEEPMVFQRGDRVRLVATFDNDTDETIRYGTRSSDEMMFLFYISHPNTPDVNRDEIVDAEDIDRLSQEVRRGSGNLARFDLNFDDVLDDADRVRWVRGHMKTFFGDSNLDGEFNSGDLVAVFASGEYEDELPLNSGWAKGDWDGDGDFTSRDLVLAFQDGGYEQGPRPALAAVPEPNGIGMMAIALALAAVSSTRRKGRRF